jgi:hypothetical protein
MKKSMTIFVTLFLITACNKPGGNKGILSGTGYYETVPSEEIKTLESEDAKILKDSTYYHESDTIHVK